MKKKQIIDNINSLPPQDGRIIIVTGANSGLGYETTLILAKKGAKVIMACRNLSKANTAKTEIENKAPTADLEVMEIDLSSLNSVRNFAKEYKSKFNRLDVLINNAGVMTPPYTKTEDISLLACHRQMTGTNFVIVEASVSSHEVWRHSSEIKRNDYANNYKAIK